MAWVDFMLVFAGGGVGAVCRYGATSLPGIADGKYWLTMVVNLTGCLLIGIVWALLNAAGASRLWSLLLITGILGGYTTFSAFGLETVRLLAAGQFWAPAAYVAASVVGGITLCAAGLFVTQSLIRP